MKHTLLIFGLLWALGASGQGIYIDSYRFGAAPAATLLLDDYPNAAAAYSLRLLRTGYTGNCIEVRRSLDNTTSNIGFSGGIVDTVALKNFCGSGNCFVRTWYDQSGDNVDAVQTITTAQPSIVVSGNVVYNAGRLGLDFDGTTDILLMDTLAWTSTSISAMFVGFTRTTADDVGLSHNTPNRFYLPLHSSNNQYFGYALVSLFYNAGAISANSRAMTEVYAGTTAVHHYRNNSASGALTPATSVSDAGLGWSIGGFRAASSSLWSGVIHEVIIYKSYQFANRTGISSNINSFYSFY